jgi:hypothetical protein
VGRGGGGGGGGGWAIVQWTPRYTDYTYAWWTCHCASIIILSAERADKLGLASKQASKHGGEVRLLKEMTVS